jgi:hypothetical protein
MKGAPRLKFSYRFPSVKNDMRWIILLVILFLLILLAWPDPAAGAALRLAATPVPAATLTPTKIPAEYLSSPDQTSGIICGSAVIVLIIVGGTVGVLRRKNGLPPSK